MRWSCPHCGVNLAASDDKVGSGWSFSRCYKCGGFGLIRQAQVNVIKVDKAPAGEKIVLPEADEQPLLSQSAITQMAKHLEASKTGAMGAPALKNAQAPYYPQQPQMQFSGAQAPTKGATTARAGAASAGSQAKMAAPSPIQVTAAADQRNANSFNSSSPMPTVDAFPEALPEEPQVSLLARVIPYATAVAGMVAIGSGVYLYIHGQALWNKTRVALQDINPPNEVMDQVSSTASAPQQATSQHSSTSNGEPSNHARAGGLQIRVKSGTASLHQGPGAEYPTVGSAHSEQTLQVIDWNSNWFKVTVPSGAARKVGWIRSDLVNKMSTADDQGT